MSLRMSVIHISPCLLTFLSLREDPCTKLLLFWYDTGIMSDGNLERAKEEAEKVYGAIREVNCPYLKSIVVFNRKGLNHVKFKSDQKARNRSDQYMRLRHLKFAPRILEKSCTLQEYKEAKTFEETKSKGNRQRVLKNTKFYGFIAIVQDNGFTKRLKIIVKEVEGGRKHFWSIVPYWKSNRELKIHSGNPETD